MRVRPLSSKYAAMYFCSAFVVIAVLGAAVWTTIPAERDYRAAQGGSSGPVAAVLTGLLSGLAWLAGLAAGIFLLRSITCDASRQVGRTEVDIASVGGSQLGAPLIDYIESSDRVVNPYEADLEQGDGEQAASEQVDGEQVVSAQVDGAQAREDQPGLLLDIPQAEMRRRPQWVSRMYAGILLGANVVSLGLSVICNRDHLSESYAGGMIIYDNALLYCAVITASMLGGFCVSKSLNPQKAKCFARPELPQGVFQPAEMASDALDVVVGSDGNVTPRTPRA